MIKRYSQDSDYRLYECADGELVKYDEVEFLLFPSDELLERLKAANGLHWSVVRRGRAIR